MSQETFTVENPYTLRVDRDHFSYSSQSRGITREFNFKARQVTTVYHDQLRTSNGVAVTSQMAVQNFCDIEGTDEIRDMHAKLVELGGKPPAIDDLLGTPGKGKLSAPAAG